MVAHPTVADPSAVLPTEVCSSQYQTEDLVAARVCGRPQHHCTPATQKTDEMGREERE